MDQITTLLLVAAAAAMICILLCLVKGCKPSVFCKRVPRYNAASSELPCPGAINCRVRPAKQKDEKCDADVFSVEICGSIHAPADMHYATVQISITDITDGIAGARPVHSRIPNRQIQDSPAFVYNNDLGRLPNRITTLSDWTAVAALPLDRLIFPRKGKTMLQFNISVLSRESGEELAHGICTFPYENLSIGYINQQENTRCTKTLAVALAFAVAAADGKLYDCEIEVITNWVKDNFDTSKEPNKTSRKIKKALNKTIRFFRNGNQLDTRKICKEIVEIAHPAERYDILGLCLRVVQAKGFATAEELTFLKNLANGLEVDAERFRTMMEKILPVNMHRLEDMEVVLGVTPNMSREQTRRHLNKEYRKWNARVTSFDSQIQSQADYMLKIIAEARSKYTGQGVPE